MQAALSGRRVCYNSNQEWRVKTKLKEAATPIAKQDTIRREILFALQERQYSAKELSSEIRISEREVCDHLEHIRKTANNSGQHLTVMAAECKKCGFIFSKRERLKKPGKCPLCRSESIHEPLFSLERNS